MIVGVNDKAFLNYHVTVVGNRLILHNACIPILLMYRIYEKLNRRDGAQLDCGGERVQ